MPQQHYHKTLFIPELQGQFKAWRKDLTQMCNKADKIVQFGNIIGCNDFVKDQQSHGPNNNMLKYILLYRATENNWTQLIGPNEIAAFNFPDNWTNKKSRQILRHGWLSSSPNIMVAAVHNDALVTHGGLTHGEWISIGSPQDAETAAKRLNEKYVGTLYQGQCFALGNPPNYAANPIWADSITEVYPSWITTTDIMPFPQIHAGRNINSTVGREAVTQDNSLYEYSDDIRYTSYGSHITINKQQITGLYMPLNGKIIDRLPRPYTLYMEKRKI